MEAIVQFSAAVESAAASYKASEANKSKGVTISQILAQILVMSGHVLQRELVMLNQASEQMQIPLGRILVMCRRLTEDELHTALTAAQQVRTANLSREEAAVLVAYCLHNRIPFENVWQKAIYRRADIVTLMLITSGGLPIEKAENVSPGTDNKIHGYDLYTGNLISMRKWREMVDTAHKIESGKLTAGVIFCEELFTKTGEHAAC